MARRRQTQSSAPEIKDVPVNTGLWRTQHPGEIVKPKLKEPPAEGSSSDDELCITPNTRQFQEYLSRYSSSFRMSLGSLEQPRQITFAGLLVLGVTLIGFVAHHLSDGDRPLDSQIGFTLRLTCGGLVLAMSIYAITQTRDYIFFRPHPAVWRVLHIWGLLYILMLITMISLPASSGFALTGFLFQRPPPRPEENPIGPKLNCELNQVNLLQGIQSVWFLCHLVGWFLKMIAMRSWMICLLSAFIFECFELSLQWLIPEFQECWWDSVILDFCGANITGMVLGDLFIRIFQLKKYRYCCVPLPFDKTVWENGSFSTVLQAHCVPSVQAMWEVMLFFLMRTLNFEEKNWMVLVRSLLMLLVGGAALSEWQVYFDNRVDRLGGNFLLFMLMGSLEGVLSFKFAIYYGIFQSSKVDLDILRGWVSFGLCSLVWTVIAYMVTRGKTDVNLSCWIKGGSFLCYIPLIYYLSGKYAG